MNACVAFLGIALLAAVANKDSAAVPPPLWTESFEWAANVDADPVHPFRIGPLEVVLETTTLQEVQSRVGYGTVAHSGDASEALDWLCYSLTRDEAKSTLWLSSSEMGGGKVIDGMTVVESPTTQPGESCPGLPAEYASAHLENGLWLGSTKRQVLDILGIPLKRGDSWNYVFEGKSGDFDVSSDLSFRFDRGRVVGIRLSRTSSN